RRRVDTTEPERRDAAQRRRIDLVHDDAALAVFATTADETVNGHHDRIATGRERDHRGRRGGTGLVDLAHLALRLTFVGKRGANEAQERRIETTSAGGAARIDEQRGLRHAGRLAHFCAARDRLRRPTNTGRKTRVRATGSSTARLAHAA